MTVVMAACALTGARAQAPTPLQGSAAALRPGDRPAQVLAAARHDRWQRFDATRMQDIDSDRRGAWVVLFPRAGALPAQVPLTLSIRASPYARFTLYDEHGHVLGSNSLRDFSALPHAWGRIIFELPAHREGAPILLRLDPSVHLAGPISFALRTRTAFRHANALWLATLGACFGIMLAMAAMGLFFGAILRDGTFLWYAGYIIAYAVIQSVMTGFVYHPLGLRWLAPAAPLLIAVALSVATPCATLFMIRFCDLRRYAPALRVLLLTLTLAMMADACGRLLPGATLHAVTESLVNPLLVLGTLSMLVAGLVAGARGSRAAWFFLAGWTPLLVLTAMASAQVNGAFATLPWLADASIPAGALEAVVLSAGLADRALNFRRDRDQARALADRDPLTGALNRRGWTDAAQARLAHAAKHPQSVLFLDLDHFKTLNDQLGHSAGDHALVAVTDALGIDLRPGDVLGRYGGEELVVFLDDTTPLDAMHIAVRLRRRVHRLELPIDRTGQLLTVSIGVAHVRPQDTVSELVDRADAAMYAAKERGRNRVVAESDVRTPPPLHAVAVRDPAGERAGGRDERAPR